MILTPYRAVQGHRGRRDEEERGGRDGGRAFLRAVRRVPVGNSGLRSGRGWKQGWARPYAAEPAAGTPFRARISDSAHANLNTNINGCTILWIYGYIICINYVKYSVSKLAGRIRDAYAFFLTEKFTTNHMCGIFLVTRYAHSYWSILIMTSLIYYISETPT